MTDGQGARLRVLVVAAYPALRAGLVSLLTSDRLLEPIATEGVERGDASSAPSAIVVDYSAGEPEEILSITEAFPATALVMIGADPATDGPGLSGAPVAYLPSDVDAAALTAAVRAAATGLIDQGHDDWRGKTESQPGFENLSAAHAAGPSKRKQTVYTYVFHVETSMPTAS